MKQIEILGLILMVYDYNPKPSEKNIYYEYKGRKNFPYQTVVEPVNYLKRKKYMDEIGLTKKAWKLLNKYNCYIKGLEYTCRIKGQLEKDQEETKE